jgi:small subunit ribosomal protein S16
VVPTRRGRCLHPNFLGETTPVAVKIKLKRMGKIHAPFYRIIVADARTKRDGRAIEEIGKYHPKNEPSLIQVDSERAQHWLSVGAQPTDPVRKILEITGDWQKFKGLPGAEGTLKAPAPKADKKDAYAAAVAEVHGTSTGSDGAKGKGRSGGKQAGRAAEDQADGDAGAAKSAPAKSGSRSSGKATASKATKADAATASKATKADAASADKAGKAEKTDKAEKAEDAKPAKANSGSKADKAEEAKADQADSGSKAEEAKADQADSGSKAEETKADQADSAKADSAKAGSAKAGKAATAEDSAGDKEPAASATEQGDGA